MTDSTGDRGRPAGGLAALLDLPAFAARLAGMGATGRGGAKGAPGRGYLPEHGDAAEPARSGTQDVPAEVGEIAAAVAEGEAPRPLPAAARRDRRLLGHAAAVWASLAALGGFAFWAGVAPVDRIVRAESAAIAAPEPHLVVAAGGGTLAEVFVAEGDAVAAGDRLIRFDSAPLDARLADLEARIAALEARRTRLEAERHGASDRPARGAGAVPDADGAAADRLLRAARQAEPTAAVEGASPSEADGGPAGDPGLGAPHLVETVPGPGAEAASRLTASEAQAERDRAAALAETQAELAALREDRRLVREERDRTVLASPVAGVVAALTVPEPGMTVEAGAVVARILPSGGATMVEACVRPGDVAAIRRGQAASIAVPALAETGFPLLAGVVRTVSAEPVRDERDPETPPLHRVTVEVDAAALAERGPDADLRPGMAAEVTVRTGQTTVLGYLAQPLHQAGAALLTP